MVSAYNIKPWAAIATDVTHAFAPGLTISRVGGIEIGKGPVVAVGANFTQVLWEIMENEAKANEIPYQRPGSSCQKWNRCLGYPSRAGWYN